MRKGLAIFLCSFCGFCDFTFPQSGARVQGLGNAFIGLSDNLYALITNPAGLSSITSYQTSFSYTTNEDKYDFLGITIPEKINGNCGIALLNKKDKALYFSYGRKIKNKPLRAGASIKIFKNNKKGIGLDLGILYLVKNHLTCGFILGNFLRPDVGYGCGLSTTFRNILFTCDIKKRERASFHFGIEKKLKGFFIRGGIDDKRLSLGFSSLISEIAIDISISPFSISFSF